MSVNIFGNAMIVKHGRFFCLPTLSRVPEKVFVNFKDLGNVEDDVYHLHVPDHVSTLYIETKTLLNANRNIPIAKHVGLLNSGKQPQEIDLFAMSGNYLDIDRLTLTNIITEIPEGIRLKSLRLSNVHIRSCIRKLIDRTPEVNIENCVIFGYGKKFNFSK